MSNEPDVFRKFHKFDPEENSNKFWIVKYWSRINVLEKTWGREGKTSTTRQWPSVTQAEVEDQIKSKLKEGYHEIELHKVTVTPVATPAPVSSGDKRVDELVAVVFKEAGEAIAKYLAVGVDALSVDQLNKGRAKLTEIGKLLPMTTDINRLKAMVKDYFNIIPPKLPMKYEWDEVVTKFMRELRNEENKLQQLETALSTYQAQQSGVTSQVLQLGNVEIKVIEPTDKLYGEYTTYVYNTSKRKVDALFSVNILDERTAFNAETRGKQRVVQLFHGTRTQNVRHILRTGLIIPQSVTNGWRLGPGVYFSDRALRSLQYTGSRYDTRHFMFIADVALGKSWQTSGTYNGSSAPQGYDSTWGTGSWSGNGDEFVVYAQSQQTIKALALVR